LPPCQRRLRAVVELLRTPGGDALAIRPRSTSWYQRVGNENIVDRRRNRTRSSRYSSPRCRAAATLGEGPRRAPTRAALRAHRSWNGMDRGMEWRERRSPPNEHSRARAPARGVPRGLQGPDRIRAAAAVRNVSRSRRRRTASNHRPSRAGTCRHPTGRQDPAVQAAGRPNPRRPAYTLGSHLVRGCVGDVAHHLPANWRGGVEQPLDERHRRTLPTF
jgi:hypothetical protein